MEEVKIWAIGDSYAAEPLESKSQVENEALLEETLVRNPDLLIPGLKLVGRQMPAGGGPLDLLGVDPDGRLAVFELKQGTLSRDAVAQIIDYASYLDAMDVDSLAEYISERSGEHGIGNIEDFQDWYGQDFGDLESLKPLRLFLVGLGTDDRTERMVRFLADNSGMDISLLTFHGFEHDGKTLLAKQVEVEGASEADLRPTRRHVSVAETRARFGRRIEESGISELFDAVRDVFKENWHDPREDINVGSLRLSLRRPSEPKWRAYARITPDPGKVQIIFYGRAFELCPDEFDQAKQEVPHNMWDGIKWPEWYELTFPVDSGGWERHKERLTALTKAVYAAWGNRDADEGPPDSESSPTE